MRRLVALFAIPVLVATASAEDGPLPPGFDKIKTIVVVYAENRSFVHLLPDHPGAFGIAEAPEEAVIQRDRDGSVLPSLPPVWREAARQAGARSALSGVDAEPAIRYRRPALRSPRRRTDRERRSIASIRTGCRSTAARTTCSSPGPTSARWRWATTGRRALGSRSSPREFTLADSFFMAAFGGSNLNHFWLACACSPHWEDAPEVKRSMLDENGNLKLAPDSPKSALEGPPKLDQRREPTRRTATWRTRCSRPTSRAPSRRHSGGDQRHADPGQRSAATADRRDHWLAAHREGYRLGLVCRGLGRGARRPWRHLQYARRSQLPAAPSALQLLRRLCAGDRSTREAPSGHEGLLDRRRSRNPSRSRLRQAGRDQQPASRRKHHGGGRPDDRHDRRHAPPEPAMGRDGDHRHP